VRVDRGAADRQLLDLERDTARATDRVEQPPRRRDDFGADAVARQRYEPE
jgi:hypothetical protein